MAWNRPIIENCISLYFRMFLQPRSNFISASLWWQIGRTALKEDTCRQNTATRLGIKSMCRGQDDCRTCRFDKCLKALCKNGIDAIRSMLSSGSVAIQYAIDVQKEHVHWRP